VGRIRLIVLLHNALINLRSCRLSRRIFSACCRVWFALVLCLISLSEDQSSLPRRIFRSLARLAQIAARSIASWCTQLLSPCLTERTLRYVAYSDVESQLPFPCVVSFLHLFVSIVTGCMSIVNWKKRQTFRGRLESKCAPSFSYSLDLHMRWYPSATIGVMLLPRSKSRLTQN
jgi:hypothetical protein